MCPRASSAAMQSCTTSVLPRITRSTFACKAPMRSIVRFNGTASRAMALIRTATKNVPGGNCAQCTVHSAQCTVHSAQCTVHGALLELLVVRAAAAFRRDPGDHLVRIHDVARLAVITVGEVQERHAPA